MIGDELLARDACQEGEKERHEMKETTVGPPGHPRQDERGVLKNLTG
jgi:hypothetical protein